MNDIDKIDYAKWICILSSIFCLFNANILLLNINNYILLSLQQHVFPIFDILNNIFESL